MMKAKNLLKNERNFKVYISEVFFADYAKDVKNFTHKMRGTDGNGKPIEFSADDKKAIVGGIKQMAKDISAQLK